MEHSLVHYAKLKKSGEPVRVDNVRNWFYRLCKDLDIKGYQFPTCEILRAPRSKIDRGLTDLSSLTATPAWRPCTSTARWWAQAR